MAEGLSHLIKTQSENGELRGIKIHEGMDAQTHQQFVDDTMLMGHPSVKELRSFKKCLTLFTKASSIAINPNKSQIFFTNTDIITQRNIIRIFGFTKGTMPSKYLGIPLGMGKLRKDSCQDLLDRMKQKLSSWVLHHLNLPSRSILVKAVM